LHILGPTYHLSRVRRRSGVNNLCPNQFVVPIVSKSVSSDACPRPHARRRQPRRRSGGPLSASRRRARPRRRRARRRERRPAGQKLPFVPPYIPAHSTKDKHIGPDVSKAPRWPSLRAGLPQAPVSAHIPSTASDAVAPASRHLHRRGDQSWQLVRPSQLHSHRNAWATLHSFGSSLTPRPPQTSVR
jgi:hypothetical protein